jgi:hypothetical protein
MADSDPRVESKMGRLLVPIFLIVFAAVVGIMVWAMVTM